MDNLELANDSGGIVGHEELLQMVDDNLVAACLEKKKKNHKMRS